jgi:hypothetical protein
MMDATWRVEVLNDAGIWESVQIADLEQGQVVRVFDSEGRPIRWQNEPDGCRIFIVTSSPIMDVVVEGEHVRIKLPLLPLLGVDKLVNS